MTKSYYLGIARGFSLQKNTKDMWLSFHLVSTVTKGDKPPCANGYHPLLAGEEGV